MVRLCAVGDATKEPVWYETMGNLQACNMATIECSVGRVQCGKRTGIIDTSIGAARTTFLDENDSGDEENVNLDA